MKPAFSRQKRSSRLKEPFFSLFREAAAVTFFLFATQKFEFIRSERLTHHSQVSREKNRRRRRSATLKTYCAINLVSLPVGLCRYAERVAMELSTRVGYPALIESKRLENFHSDFVVILLRPIGLLDDNIECPSIKLYRCDK